MAARPWNLEIGSTPRARRRIRIAKLVVSHLLGLCIVYEAVWGVTISVLAARDGELLDQMEESFNGGAGNRALITGAVLVGIFCVGIVLLSLRRRGSTVMSIVEERMAFERDVLNMELEKKLAAERAELDNWKNEQIMLMYKVVLDQQARGLLPCPSCREQYRDGRRRSA